MKKLIFSFLNTNIDIIILRSAVLTIFLVFGTFKWFEFEIEELKPLFSATWLVFLPNFFGDAGASYVLGTIETLIYICLILAFFNPKFGIIGDLGILFTSLTTLSLMIQMGFDAFLFKDILFVGASLIFLKYDLKRIYSSNK